MHKTISPGTPALNHPHWAAIEQKLEKRFGSGSKSEKWARYAIGAHLMRDEGRVETGLKMLTLAERGAVRSICSEFGIFLPSV